MSDARRERWERAAEWPLTATAVTFLAAYAWPILDPGLPRAGRDLAVALTWAAWAVFAGDYLIRFALSGSRWRFVRSHPLDLLVVVLPVLRPLRLLRLLALLNVLNRYATGSTLRGRVVLYLTGSTTLLLFLASLAVLDAERGREGANITSYPDALWWALTTVTTVGYGDRFPVTVTGRVVAGALMLGGIALLGTVTATLASYLVERVQEVEEEAQAATRKDLAALTAEVAALRRELAQDRGAPP